MAREKSELQLAADRVRIMQVAVDKMEDNLKVCEVEYHKCKIAFDEADRNMQDTLDLLAAQQSKLYREINAVRNIVGYKIVTHHNYDAEAKNPL